MPGKIPELVLFHGRNRERAEPLPTRENKGLPRWMFRPTGEETLDDSIPQADGSTSTVGEVKARLTRSFADMGLSTRQAEQMATTGLSRDLGGSRKPYPKETD